MTGFPYDLVSGGVVDTLTGFNPSPDATEGIYGPINSFHPNFNEILAGLRAGDPDVWELFNVVDAVMNRFVAISDRYSWNGQDILFDGDPLSGPLSDLLTECLQTGKTDDLFAVAKFGENLAMNPNPHSREQAFGWLARYNFQITSEGYVVVYKGLQLTDDPEVFTSTWASQVPGKPSGFVNGVPVPELSTIPQKVGDKVTLPRSEVLHDPMVACSRGLHAATESYARVYGGVVGVGLVHPRDIVSVPHSGAKMRTCGYVLVSTDASGLSTAPVLSGAAVSGWQGDVGYKV
jgi:hypothetical protein